MFSLLGDESLGKAAEVWLFYYYKGEGGGHVVDI